MVQPRLVARQCQHQEGKREVGVQEDKELGVVPQEIKALIVDIKIPKPFQVNDIMTQCVNIVSH